MAAPVTICKHLAANVFSNDGTALKVHEHTADGGLLGTCQLLICYFACNSLQKEVCAMTKVYRWTLQSLAASAMLKHGTTFSVVVDYLISNVCFQQPTLR